MTDKKYTLKEAAARLGVHERTVRRRVIAGVIASITGPPKHGVSDQYFITEAALTAYEASINKPSYGDLAKEAKALRREFSRFVGRFEAGTVNDGDLTRAKMALEGDGD